MRCMWCCQRCRLSRCWLWTLPWFVRYNQKHISVVILGNSTTETHGKPSPAYSGAWARPPTPERHSEPQRRAAPPGNTETVKTPQNLIRHSYGRHGSVWFLGHTSRLGLSYCKQTDGGSTLYTFNNIQQHSTSFNIIQLANWPGRWSSTCQTRDPIVGLCKWQRPRHTWP